ncbi:hypothetical protein ORV05_23120 [Amycolatopsis cynarae]|uniref:Uncharacterized protein n=1 Tax=Amycolatopsis cynarae TaxID=2995223 RepID=A0ABY7AWK2_9PSEU|nr:hypothetical protein [Amycolatopsis sp. HUAS 11-8]WAL63873.1 hypothetical protein ORV05_23120 [Amycolatopsis sp. HUAS 11-8]
MSWTLIVAKNHRGKEHTNVWSVGEQSSHHGDFSGKPGEFGHFGCSTVDGDQTEGVFTSPDR